MSENASKQFPREIAADGSFKRQVSAFRNWVGTAGLEAAHGRYHLYVSYACPWASRAIIVRKLKGLESAIGISVVDPIRDDKGWAFRDVVGADSVDPINAFRYLSEAYQLTSPRFSDRVTVPLLWDKQNNLAVNNESSEIIRMLNSEFNEFADNPELDLYPDDLRDEIDQINDFVYENVNNGVYKAGFAANQRAYETAVRSLFEALESLEQRLSTSRYLVGDVISEADWRLFVTLVRFDVVYVGHFKCNLKRIQDFPNLSGYLLDLYQHPGIAETVNFDHIKRHYYVTHKAINPTSVVPLGPQIDWSQPHNRERTYG